MKSLKFTLLIIFYQFILLSWSFASETDECAKIDNAILSLEVRITEHLAKFANSHSSIANNCDSGVNDIFVDIINLYKEEIEEYQKKVKFCQSHETSQPQQTLAYRWVDLRGANRLPNNPVLGGQNVDKLPLHVVRGKGSESDSYGKLYKNQDKYMFYATDENTELVKESFEVSLNCLIGIGLF